MKRKILSGLLLTAFSLALLLFPWPGNYQSPLLWARKDETVSQPVDVFLIGATADLGKDGTFQSSTYLPIDRHWQERLLNLQEGLYADSCRIFAPYYSQVCLSTYYLKDADRGPYFAVAYKDLRNAFLYYLEHENQGRPFLLAGYSQGADLGLRLMEEFFDDQSLQSRLVAAYLIGWRITEEDLSRFPHLKMAQGETDTGVIISYNSEAGYVTGSIILPEGGYTYGINPLNWCVDSTPADKSENPGTVSLHMDGSADNDRPGFTGCYRSETRGTLIIPDITSAEFPPGEPLFVDGCYHNFELELFYRSIQQNVKTRVAAYFSAS